MELISFLIGAVISLFCERIPRFKDRFHQLDGEDKQLVIIALSMVVTLVINQLGCWGYIEMECKEWSVLADALIVWISSQITHIGTKEILKDVNKNTVQTNK